MSGVNKSEAVAVTFNTETVGSGMNVESIARAINSKLEGRQYLGHQAISRQDLGEDFKGPDGLILFVTSERADGKGHRQA
jgi:hypothetical protein